MIAEQSSNFTFGLCKAMIGAVAESIGTGSNESYEWSSVRNSKSCEWETVRNSHGWFTGSTVGLYFLFGSFSFKLLPCSKMHDYLSTVQESAR